MSEVHEYDDSVRIIKEAILRSQYDAACAVNEKQLVLYFGIGKYVSLNSRKGFWGKGAIDTISGKLQRELPGLRGFSARNLRYMRAFYEEWSMLDATQVPECSTFSSPALPWFSFAVWTLYWSGMLPNCCVITCGSAKAFTVCVKMSILLSP